MPIDRGERRDAGEQQHGDAQRLRQHVGRRDAAQMSDSPDERDAHQVGERDHDQRGDRDERRISDAATQSAARRSQTSRAAPGMTEPVPHRWCPLPAERQSHQLSKPTLSTRFAAAFLCFAISASGSVSGLSVP